MASGQWREPAGKRDEHAPGVPREKGGGKGNGHREDGVKILVLQTYRPFLGQ